MNSKIYALSSDSKLEATRCNLELTNYLPNATYFVNPIWNNLSGKIIIIDLPYNIDLKKLSENNKLILRYNLGDIGIEYEYEPFEEIDFQVSNNPKPYSNRILNKYMLMDPNYIVDVTDRYLLGTEVIVNNSLTLTGYMIVRTIKT